MSPIAIIKDRGAFVRHSFAVLTLALAWAWLALQPQSVFAAMAPANSVIGNQASATYVDNTSTTRTSTSNTVQTTVAQVTAFTLTQTGMKSAPANQQVCYPHTISNTGNGADTFTLIAPTTGGMFTHTALNYYLDADSNGIPDNGTSITTTGSLAAGTSFNFVVCGTTATTATNGQQGTITVSASNASASPTTQSQTDTTTISASSIVVNKKLSSVPPPGYTPVASGASPNGGPLYVILEYTNSGTIPADGLVLNDPLPAGWIYVPGSGRWSGSGATALTDAAGGDPAGISYSAPTTAISGTVAATINTVAGSTNGNLYFQITIAPNLAVTVPANEPVTTNTASSRYSYQFGGNTICMPSNTVIAGANMGASCPTTGSPTNSVLYSVAQTASVVANGSATTTGNTDGEPVTVASAAPGQTIAWTDYIWNTGNGTDTFDITIANTDLAGAACNVANNAAAGQCTFPTNTTFQIFASNGTTTLLNSGGSSAPDTGPIPVPDSMGNCPAPYIVSSSPPLRCGYPIVIKATLPIGAAAGNNGGNGYQITVQATSAFNPAVSETVPNRLTAIAANTVDLTNNLSIAGGATAANGLGPDDMTVKTTNSVTPSTSTTTTTRFRLFVNNTSSLAQIYNLNSSWISVPAGAGLSNPPVGWTVTFRDDGGAGDCSTVTGGAITSTGATPIAAGSSKLICAEVVVPSTNSGAAPATPTYAAVGNYVVQFGVTQQSNPAVSDTKRDQITIQPVHNVTLTPNGAQSTVPSGAVTYNHTLANSGNSTETITFPTASFLTNSQVPAYSWSTTAYIDTNNNGVLDVGTDTQIVAGTTSFALAPNATQTIFVRVNAPASAGSPPNVTTLTATYNAGASTTSATDTTTLTDGLKLDKYQQSPGGTGSCTTIPATTLTGGVPNAPWSNMAIAAGANTVPGKCIAYLVVGTNTTAANITSINVSDVVPPNTKLETGCGAPSVTGPIALTGTYASGFTGTIVAQSSPTAATPLPPTNTFTLQFCVKINDM